MKPPKDPVAQSVFDRLKTLAVQRKEDFNSLLARYSNERFLYRLSRTEHAPRFVLKGAMLFVVWLNRLHRPTRDMDFLGYGEITEQNLRAVFTGICGLEAEPDGLVFDASSIEVEALRENQVYHGLRVKIAGKLGNARANIQIDVGIGDAVFPEPVEIDYPTLLNLPSPRLKIYPAETVVAEKLDAMLQLGLRNSRMKDFFDLWLISRTFTFDGVVLSEAVRRTTERRQTIVDDVPVCFTDEFVEDPSKQNQWKAFLRQGRLSEAPDNFTDAMAILRPFLQPLVTAVRSNSGFAMRWPAGGPWR